MVQPNRNAARNQATPRNNNVSEAYAPYNFVPLPEVIVPAPSKEAYPPSHDSFSEGRHTGYFTVSLTTRSPLYIRCALTKVLFERDQEQQDRNGQTVSKNTRYRDRIKNTPQFFYTFDPLQPVIPGSSLRGMLRSMLEIVSYSKFDRLSKSRLFYRDMRNEDYRNRITAITKNHPNGLDINRNSSGSRDPVSVVCDSYRSKVRAGFFRKLSGGGYGIEECAVARLQEDDVARALGLHGQRDLYSGPTFKDPGPNDKPYWKTRTAAGTEVEVQRRSLWAAVDDEAQNYFFKEQYRQDRTGTLLTDRSGNPLIRHGDQYLEFRLAEKLRTAPPVSTDVAGPGKTWYEGTLALTGPMQNKHLGFLFLHNPSPGALLRIPDSNTEKNPDRQVLDRFLKDQLTPWQEQAFPEHRNGKRAEDDGYLCEGDPVFFFAETLPDGTEQVSFFGRALMFRLPYLNGPDDLVPTHLKENILDYADALFGFVRSEDNDKKSSQSGQAYAGRVFVMDGVLAEPGAKDIWLSNNPAVPTELTPRILASPKPTSYQHYLDQPAQGKPINYDQAKQRGGYNLRGYKLYWHQGEPEGTQDSAWIQRIKEPNVPNNTQHTLMMPVRPGVQFHFRVYFENLLPEELGALCWILRPALETGRCYAHKLGMGKPYGLGSVTLNPTLTLTNRKNRYTTLFEGNDWNPGAPPTDMDFQTAYDKFEKHLLGALQPKTPCQHLSQLKRIAMFLNLLQCRDNVDFAGYMSLAEFNRRPILPYADDPKFGKMTGNIVAAVYSLPPPIDKRPTQITEPVPPPPPPVDMDTQELKNISTSIGSIRGAGEINKLEQAVTRLSKLPASPERTEVITEVQRKTINLGNAINKHKEKPWYKQLMEWVEKGNA